MDIETDDRGFGNKRIYQRLGPASRQPDRGGGRVCKYWQAGRCNRQQCQFLHGEPPATHESSQRSFAWRNPSSGVGGAPNEGNQKWGKSRGDNTTRLNGGTGTSQGGVLCKYFLSGSCSYGERCKFVHSWSVGDSFSLLTTLNGHGKVITAITLPSGSDKLYSASKDEMVKVWDCQTGQCTATVSMGREVGCMISEEPWLFVGVTDSIKTWNTQTGAEMTLSGPRGQVYALVTANELLFAGTQDGSILVWRFSAANNCFEPAASLVGHHLAVISLVVGAMRLYSGSMDKTIKVWDLTTLQCIQTLSDHTNVVMGLLCWDQFLISCSLDNTVKIWVCTEKDKLEVTYTHSEDSGVIALSGMLDAQGKPVLLCALNDNSVRIYDLPSFKDRGRIFAKQEVRAVHTGPGGLFFTGDGTGELRVWQWTTKQ